MASERVHPITGASFNERRLTHRQFALLIALASSGMLFGTLLLSYFLGRARMPVWPPLGVEPFPPLLPVLSLPLLFAVSATLHMAWKKWLDGKLESFRPLWYTATALGTSFLGLQVALWMQLLDLGIRVNSNLFSSIIWVLTVVHATHVVVAVGLLWKLALKLRQPLALRRTNPESPRLVGYFWHFLDVVWGLMIVSLMA